MIDFYMLGTSGTYPFVDRAFSSCVARINGKGFLFDCGEGTQIQLQKYPVTAHDIDYILVSHLHADHVSGIFGMLLTMKENGRTKPVTIVGPCGIKCFIEGMFMATRSACIPVNYVELDYKGEDLEINDGNVIIKSCKANHSVPCFAYSLELTRNPKFKPEIAEGYGIPVRYWSYLAKGIDVEVDGVTYDSKEFVGEPRKGLKISYVTDTRPSAKLIEFIDGSDIAVVEGMFKEDDKASDAKKKKHMLWREAAVMVKGRAKEAILTHYSPSLQVNYADDEKFAKGLAPNLTLGYDGLTRTLNYTDE